MSKDRFKLVPVVYLLLIKDNKVLLGRRQNTGFMDGYYMVPAGHVDGNEAAKDAMIREAKEEVGIDIDRNDLEFSLILHKLSEDREDVCWYFECKNWNGEVKNMEPNKCSEIKFFDIDNLPADTIPYIREVIEAYQRGENYLEIGFAA